MNNTYKEICKELAKAMNCEGGEFIAAVKIDSDGACKRTKLIVKMSLGEQIDIIETMLGHIFSYESLRDEDFITVYDTICPILHNEYDRRFGKESKA